jgi:hypothetical protein
MAWHDLLSLRFAIHRPRRVPPFNEQFEDLENSEVIINDQIILPARLAFRLLSICRSLLRFESPSIRILEMDLAGLSRTLSIDTNLYTLAPIR